MVEDSKTLYFIAGVTASGKTEISLEWAERNNAEIISCDSVALYKGMDIGTAKPSLRDQRRVRHHGLDIVTPDQVFDVSKYSDYARKVVRDISKKKSNILVVGGSGFYLRSFFSAVVDEVFVSANIKKFVSALFQEKGLYGLIEELKKYNPDGFGQLDSANPVRVIKSLERCIATGNSIAEVNSKFQKKVPPFIDFKKKMARVDRDNDDLEKRIKIRTSQMIKNGLIEEVEKLLDCGLEKNYPAAHAVGYRETISFLLGKLNRAELEKEIRVSTRKLVSKQRKWFRKYYPYECTNLSDQKFGSDSSVLKWFSET